GEFGKHSYFTSVFKIPLSRFLEPEMSEKTRMVSEHLDDCHFYEFIANNFSEHRHLPSSIAFDLLNGGGDVTFQVFEEKINKKYIAFAIADSDKREPEAAIGTTGKKVIEIFETYKIENIISCEILPVHEKENLFSS